jgi:hypothetical protein
MTPNKERSSDKEDDAINTVLVAHSANFPVHTLNHSVKLLSMNHFGSCSQYTCFFYIYTVPVEVVYLLHLTYFHTYFLKPLLYSLYFETTNTGHRTTNTGDRTTNTGVGQLTLEIGQPTQEVGQPTPETGQPTWETEQPIQEITTIAGHWHRGNQRQHWHSGIHYFSPVPDQKSWTVSAWSGTGSVPAPLIFIIPVLD